MVIWITGMSASGKSSLCNHFKSIYKDEFPSIFILDGDVIRDFYGNDLGYEVSDRVVQVKRMQKIAKFCESQGALVLVAILYGNDELLSENRHIFADYREVYIKADIQKLERREFKGLYSGARAGHIKNVVGVDIKWIEPKRPDLVFDISTNDYELDYMAAELRSLLHS